MRYSGDREAFDEQEMLPDNGGGFLSKEPIDYNMVCQSAVPLVVIFFLAIPVLFNLWHVALFGIDGRNTATIVTLCALASIDYIAVLVYHKKLNIYSISLIPITLLSAFCVGWFDDGDVIWFPVTYVGMTGYWIYELLKARLEYFSEKNMRSESKAMQIGLYFSVAALVFY